MRVLLVESRPIDGERVGDMVRELGDVIELSHVDRLEAVRDHLDREPADVILLDLGRADANGFDLLRRIVELAPGLPLVGLIDKDEEAAVLGSMRSGAQDCLVRGDFDARLLLRTLRAAIERKRLRVTDRFLAKAGRLLAATLDLEETLQRIERLAVESIADFCVMDLVGDDQRLHGLRVAHADPSRADLARRLTEFPLDRRRSHLLFRAEQIRKPLLVASVDPEFLAGVAQDEQHLAMLRDLRIQSLVAAPLIARSQLLGTITLVSSSRSYTQHELALAEGLAHSAALEIHNARLFQSAQEAVRARDRVLGVVAHDLRSPLGTITMSAELLLDQILAPEQQLQQLQIIRRTADRMNRLIQDLLDGARIDRGQLVLQLEHQDAAALALETVELNSALAAAKSIQLDCEAGRNPAPILADRDRILRVLENLVGNAIKFTPAGGRITVRVETRPDDSSVCFSVTDTGPGIAAEHLSSLFLPFWQASRSPTSGAGLGLAIAKGIVEAHGGSIWVESTPGVATTVAFSLPAAEERRQARQP